MDGNKRKRRMRGITPELQQAAWLLRAKMTPAEQALWEAVRDHRLHGLRCRRQHPVGQFALDLYCARHNLVIELDGGVHDTQAEQDAARTAYLNTYGYRVIRFRNEEVLTDLPSVLERIIAAIRGEEAPRPPILGE